MKSKGSPPVNGFDIHRKTQDKSRKSDVSLYRSHSLPTKSYRTWNHMTEITRHLYLSNARAVTGDTVRSLGITQIINCTLDIPHVNLAHVKYTRICVEDRPRSNLGKYFNKVSDKVRKEASRGGRTLIHCYAGVSRSASLCLAYLMKYHRMTLKKAYYYLKKQRPIVNPNIGFWRQLIDFEKRLSGFKSVHLVSIREGVYPDVYLHNIMEDKAVVDFRKAPSAGGYPVVGYREYPYPALLVTRV